MIGPVVELVRTGGSAALRRAIAGDDGLSEAELASADDPGWFGPASVVWRVHGSPSMLIGGLRALLLQTLHPLAMAGVAEHSDYRHDPWGRLHRTGRFVGATTYGSTPTAETAIAAVRAVHERVRGIAPDGRPYAASDPHLLLWVHITEVDSFLRAYERYGTGRLTAAERDAYVREMSVIADSLGAEPAPRTVAELEAALARFRRECRATRQSRTATRFLLNPPVAILARPAYAIIAAAAIGLLPHWARRQLLVPLPPCADPLAVRPAARLVTAAIGWLMSADTRAGNPFPA
jgi:uncharacterized protein (DUF2236 family)